MDINKFLNSHELSVVATRNKVIAIAIVVLLVVGIVIATYLTQNKQVLKSRAFGSSEITILTPEEDEIISGLVKVAATSNTEEEPSKLYGFFKVGDNKPQKLKFRKLDTGEVSLSGRAETEYSDGDYNLELSLYTLASGSPILIGKTSMPITISK